MDAFRAYAKQPARVDALYAALWVGLYASGRTVFADDESVGHWGVRAALTLMTLAYATWAVVVLVRVRFQVDR